MNPADRSDEHRQIALTAREAACIRASLHLWQIWQTRPPTIYEARALFDIAGYDGQQSRLTEAEVRDLIGRFDIGAGDFATSDANAGCSNNIGALGSTQRRVLGFIQEYIALHHRPPTHREIAHGAGMRSTGHVMYHIRRLEQKGFLRRPRGALARGISLTQMGEPTEQPGQRRL